MEKETVDFTKPLQTRDGREARVFMTDAGGDLPILGAVKGPNAWYSTRWHATGRYVQIGIHKLDLVNVKRKFSGKVIVVVDSSSNMVEVYRGTSFRRVQKICPDAVAIVEVPWEATEGEGKEGGA